MNLYIRYFDRETLVSNVDQALDFLHSIQDINVTPDLEEDLRNYAESDVYFPKRYKVRSHVYFIVIKTLANTMLEFKQKKALRPNGNQGSNDRRQMADNAVNRLMEVRSGWYEGDLNFKRVVLIPATGKHEYRDTRFVARCKANSPMQCYERIVDYLRGRVDNRSQFPSAKGKNFHYQYLGMWK
ncbi:MAG: hypothetical protein ACOYJF_10385 [Prevotella sp.]